MPTGRTRARLAEWIAKLSAEHGTVRFPPHVTLLGGIPRHTANAAVVTRGLAKSLPPFAVRVEAVASGNTYFRCVFLKVTPASSLLAAHVRSRRAFGLPNTRFFPHLSLIYGTLDRGEKRELLREIAIEPFVFRASRVHLWLTHGHVRAWRQLAAARLSGSPG
jgi:2'-5' RNA ligase